MLQRIQTVYWSLSILFQAILFSGINLVTFKKGVFTFKLSIFSLKQFDFSEKLINETYNYNYFLLIFIILFSSYTIFQFKKLKKQLNLAKWVMYGNFLITIQFVLFSYAGMVVSNPIIVKLDFPISFLFISCILSVLAYLGVKKDKSLLDSVDRIR